MLRMRRARAWGAKLAPIWLGEALARITSAVLRAVWMGKTSSESPGAPPQEYRKVRSILIVNLFYLVRLG